MSDPVFSEAVHVLREAGHDAFFTRSSLVDLGMNVTRVAGLVGKTERAFLEELAAHGVVTGNYNLPDWEETPAGFSDLLEHLFLHTPPTALIIDEAARYSAAVEFLARRGIKVPEHVSLVSTDDDPALAWCHPPIAHMRWDSKPVIRRVVRWVEAVRKGTPDRKIINHPAEFVPGGSIGPVRQE